LDFAQYDENGSSSVYNVLCLGSGNSEGFAMSYVLLCRQSGITCQLVQGTLNGVPHDWNIITLNGQSWHMDLTLGDEDGARYTDAEMTAMGYQWSQDDYPVCTGYAEDENISDFSENTP
jgi:transglutaminase-like putative cysteine protease